MDSAMRKREEGFDIVSIPHAKLTEYSALHDPNMRHYFENPKVQRLLYETGQIDKHGRVIDLNRNKAKLNILEREFKKAEEAEEARIKEEEEMRVSGVAWRAPACCCADRDTPFCVLYAVPRAAHPLQRARAHPQAGPAAEDEGGHQPE